MRLEFLDWLLCLESTSTRGCGGVIGGDNMCGGVIGRRELSKAATAASQPVYFLWQQFLKPDT